MDTGSGYHKGESSKRHVERRREPERTPEAMRTPWMDTLLEDPDRTEPYLSYRRECLAKTLKAQEETHRLEEKRRRRPSRSPTLTERRGMQEGTRQASPGKTR